MYLLRASATAFFEREPYYVRTPRTPGRVCNFTYNADEAYQCEGHQRAQEMAARLQSALRERHPGWCVRAVRQDGEA